MCMGVLSAHLCTMYTHLCTMYTQCLWGTEKDVGSPGIQWVQSLEPRSSLAPSTVLENGRGQFYG